MNWLRGLSSLSNTWFAVRVGQTEAEDADEIRSDPKTVRHHWGLTPKGKQDLLDSARQAKKDFNLNRETIVLCSPLRCAVESARLICHELRCRHFIISDALRERWYGEFEGKPVSNFRLIWEEDRENSRQSRYGVESPTDVLFRVTDAVIKAENEYVGRNILVVSPCDPLRILATGFAKINPSEHVRMLIYPAQFIKLKLSTKGR